MRFLKTSGTETTYCTNSERTEKELTYTKNIAE